MLQIETYWVMTESVRALDNPCPRFSGVFFVKSTCFLLIFAAIAAANPIYTVADLGGLGRAGQRLRRQ